MSDGQTPPKSDLEALIEALQRPDAYPHPVDAVEVFHTHGSVVFVAGDFAYKIKKPVKFEFLDYSTLEKRRHYCRREVELNRRLAPEIYLDVVPIGLVAGAPRVGERDEVVEYAVKMVRLRESATFAAKARQAS